MWGILIVRGAILQVRTPRTPVWLVLALVGLVYLAPPACTETEILGGLVLIDAGEGVGGAELEASMSSLLLDGLQDLAESPQPLDATEGPESQQDMVVFPDSSASVGRMFQIRVLSEMEDVYLEDVKVSLKVLSFQVTVSSTEKQ